MNLEESKRPTVSLTMFVRNEAETLERAVNSVRELVDEIVIGVDKSSTDGTYQVAESLSTICYTFDWKNDFSAARNLSLEKCSCDWILILDGHEYLSSESLPLFSKIFEKIPDYVTGIGFKIQMEDGAAGQQYRLLKNGVGWSYKGKVHHQLNVSEVDPDGRNWGFRDVVVVHDPTPENREIRKKQREKMVFRLMEEEISKDPTNVRAAYYLGVMHHEAGRFEEAIDFYKKYLKHTKDKAEERYLVNWQSGRCFKAIGKEWEALQRFRQCISWIWWLPLAHVTIGEIFLERGRKDPKHIPESEHYFKTAQQLASEHRPPDSSAFYPQPFFTWLPWWKLAEVYDAAGECEQALYCALQVLNFSDLPEEQRTQAEGAIIEWRKIIKETLTVSSAEAAQVIEDYDSTKKNVVIFDSIGSFTGDIASRLSETYNVRVLKEFDPAWAWWANILWFEWCDGNLVKGSGMEKNGSKIICRIHAYEAYYSDAPKLVDWSKVDDVIFVADHVREYFKEKKPEVNECEIHTIPNGIDLNKWEYRQRGHGSRIGYMGCLNHKKNVPMLLQMFSELPDNYSLRIIGTYQDEALERFVRHYLKKDNLTNRVEIIDWTDEPDKLLEEIDYVISPSMTEAFNYVVGEGMAKGIKPLIFDWEGASDTWGGEFIFRNSKQLREMLSPESPYESEKYRRIAEKYSLERQMKSIDVLMNGGYSSENERVTVTEQESTESFQPMVA